MKSNAVLIWLAVLFVFSGSMLVFLLVRMRNQNDAPPSGGVAVRDPYAAPNVSSDPITEFTLTERSGEEFNSSELEGEVWVASFFFANCPNSCAQQNRKVQELQREFGARGVRFVSITCDPRNDTPQRLAEYAGKFNADPEKWLFLTGNPEYIGRVGKEMFRVPVYTEAGAPTHADVLIAVDRAGSMSYYFWNNLDEFAKLKTDLKGMISMTAEEAQAAAEAARAEAEAARGASEAEAPEAESAESEGSDQEGSTEEAGAEQSDAEEADAPKEIEAEAGSSDEAASDEATSTEEEATEAEAEPAPTA